MKKIDKQSNVQLSNIKFSKLTRRSKKFDAKLLNVFIKRFTGNLL